LTPSKATRRIVCYLDICKQWEGTIVELHRRSLRRFHGLRDLQKSQRDRRVGAEHRPAGDPKQQRVADLARGAGHGHLDRGAHAVKVTSWANRGSFRSLW